MYTLYMPIPIYIKNTRMLSVFVRRLNLKFEWDSAGLYAKSPCWIVYSGCNFVGYLTNEN